MTASTRAPLRVPPPQVAPKTPFVLPHQSFMDLQVPDPVTFVLSPLWLGRRLYPRQVTLIKIIFLRVDLLTDYDLMVIADWEQSWLLTNGENGLPPGIVERMGYLRGRGHSWFREVLLVMGRRGGKGYICSLAMAYVLWNYLSKHDPQEYYGIDRDRQLTCLIYAGRKDQARDNLWRDLINAIQGSACFLPYISKPMGESLTVMAPADRTKRHKLVREGIHSGIDQSTFRIEPLPATPMSGRGGASFMIGMDEMAHMINSGANRSSDEVWKAATPALDQFKKDAFIACPSSPWEMIGQFYVEYQQAQEKDPDTGEWVYPEKFVLQLASWDIYVDYEIAHEIDLFPEDFGGDLGEYVEQEPPRLPQIRLAIQEYDDEMRKLERADPDTFAVERMAHWQTSLDHYLDPKKIAAMFDNGLSITTKGTMANYYKGHADPSVVNDMFGLAVAHTETGPDGFMRVIFDYLHHWDPADAPEHTLDYVKINGELWDLISGYPIDDFTFDQYNSHFFISDLVGKVRTAQLPKRVNVAVINETASYNLKVAETFKVALNQGWVLAPYYEQADLELRFLQFKNGKVIHQTTGPVQHDDVARSMMEVVYGLLEQQVTAYLTQGTLQMAPTLAGGSTPWMSPTHDDMAIINQFGAAHLPRDVSGYSPARGYKNAGTRSQFGMGRFTGRRR